MTGNTADTQLEAERLTKLLEPTVASHQLVLEEVQVRKAGDQRIVHVVIDLIDGTDGIVLDQIAEVSRSISEALDTDPFDTSAPYELEVSSPGTSRPLTLPRHWHRNVGRLVKVNVIGEDNLLGRLIEVTDSGITIIPDIPVKKGMKPKVGEPRTLAFEVIRRGNVEVDFARAESADITAIELDDEDEENVEA
ncbi:MULTISPECIES: ribosome maturation factor RimP [Paeniglutamicibacter]|jgi:ribosome maturation factor RimP|uniref:Ribosome maturation factor RimP n=1 Tax=Paeniglutamicibacter terrestris TaxID=2723403 RepID=A0ABX1G904_9MICC|nr:MULTISPECIES: ribosome maturation factor RimP [Paeniglutamicibacter]ASN40037.1 ribosome maturation factor RimP [Arthrobacter sp. 7749]NKG22061.1 ribosome maturation factor RimP [Paeniglutamicibacter terrestris]QXQ11259.1 ribosome maturation factor RimP [Paeniglutamicibacter sp. Y32M11]